VKPSFKNSVQLDSAGRVQSNLEIMSSEKVVLPGVI